MQARQLLMSLSPSGKTAVFAQAPENLTAFSNASLRTPIFVDVAATGTDPLRDRILELALLEADPDGEAGFRWPPDGLGS